MSETNLNHVVTFARKCAHLTEYAVLAVLFWRALSKPRWREPDPWNWKIASLSILFVALYAATDELHQTIVPSRQGSPVDVLIDTIGAAVGIVLLWRLRRVLESRSKRRELDAQPA